jgi:hypothetical protein
VTASSRVMRTLAASVILWWSVASGVLDAEDPVLSLRAGVGSPAGLTIELFRWSSDAERDMVMSALSAPLTPPPGSPSAAPPTPAGPAGGRGRGGRGGAPPPSPMAKLTAAIKAAPTLGYIWGQGPTGYAIKYAWRIAPVDGQPLPGPALSRVEGQDRVVFVTDRRLGAHIMPVPAAPAGSTEVEFTVIEARTDGKGFARLEVTR